MRYRPHPDVPESELLARYLYGHVTAPERERIQRWFAANPQEEIALRELDRIFAVASAGDSIEIDRFWNALTPRISAEGSATRLSSPRIPRGDALRSAPARSGRPRSSALRFHASRRALAGIGAVFVLGACGFGIALLRSARTSSSPSAMQRLAASYVTRDGQRAEVTLPDGSMALLNVGSRLDVMSDDASHARVLRLSGEALFSVRQDVRRPFIVETGNAVIRVLGTAFVVRRYPADTAALIAVRDGKVAVRGIRAAASAVVTAGHEITVVATENSRVAIVDAGRFSFAAGVLSLPWMSLREAATEMGRWYDVDMRISDSALAERRVRLIVPEASSGELSLYLETVLGVRVTRSGRTLTLHAQ